MQRPRHRLAQRRSPPLDGWKAQGPISRGKGTVQANKIRTTQLKWGAIFVLTRTAIVRRGDKEDPSSQVTPPSSASRSPWIDLEDGALG
jgi:hypothetical protein